MVTWEHGLIAWRQVKHLSPSGTGDSLKLGKVTQRTKQKLGERGRKDVGRMLK